MSYASKKGYTAEHEVLTFLSTTFGDELYRPRAGAPNDRGDILGLPLVVSVKNHSRLELSTWVKELDSMINVAHVETGIVWHKRARRGHPADWYVTTRGALALPLLMSYVERLR